MAKTEEYINRGCTITYVALDNEFAGYVILSGEYPKVCVNLQTDVR